MQKTIGQQLSAARKRKKLTLDSISEEIYIRKEFLALLEEDQFDAGPSIVQVRGFVRLYADFLKLDSKLLLSQLVPIEVDQSQISNERLDSLGEELVKSKHSKKSQQKVPKPVNLIFKKVVDIFTKKSIPISASLDQQDKGAMVSISESSDQVYKEIGSELRKNRDGLGLTFDDLEMATAIKKKHIEWIENGTLENFSSPIQARGLLQNYVKYMGMDLDAIMLRYANAILSKRQDITGKTFQKSRNIENKYKFLTVLQFLSPNLLIAIFLLSSMVCLLAWGINRISSNVIAKVTVSAPPISEILMSTQVATQAVISISEATGLALTEANLFLTPGPIETTDANITTVTPTESGQMLMNISVNQRTYLLVITDGVEKINGRVKAGDIFQFSANQSIELATGNAAAISVVYGQNDLGIMGNSGEAFHLVFTVNGAFTPTPKSSSTPTSTKAASQTPTPTRTIPAPTITPFIP